MRGKCAGSAPRLIRRLRGASAACALLFDRLGFGDRLLEVFQRQVELIEDQAWPAARSWRRSPAPCATDGEASRSSRSACRARQSPHHAQRGRSKRINISGKRISRPVHAPSTAQRRRFARAKPASDSLYRRLLHSFRRRHAPRSHANPIQPLNQRRSAFRHSRAGAPNRAPDRFDVSRVGTARHLHCDGSDHDLDAGGTALLRSLARPC